MSVNSGKNVEKEVVSLGNTTPKKRGRKPGKKAENSIIISTPKEKTAKKRTIKNISVKSSSVKEEKTKPLTTSNKKAKRTLHLNLGNFTNDNAEITDITKDENSNNIGVICDAIENEVEEVETNNFDDVDNLVNSYDLIVDDDVLDNIAEDNDNSAQETVAENDENNTDSSEEVLAQDDENNVDSVEETVIEVDDGNVDSAEETVVEVNDDNVDSVQEVVAENSDIESVSKILRNVSNSHGADTSINQNSPFFYAPSVFDKFDIDITYTDNSEEDNGAISVPEGYEQGFDSDDNYEITKIEFNVGNYVEEDDNEDENEEENNINDENIENTDDYNLQEDYNEGYLNAEDEDFDIIGGVVESPEESNNADNNENLEEENDEFDFVSYDQFDIYASQENLVQDLNEVNVLNGDENLEEEKDSAGSTNTHYTLAELEEIYDLNYLDDLETSNDTNNEENNAEGNLVEDSDSLDDLESINLGDLFSSDDLDNLVELDSSNDSETTVNLEEQPENQDNLNSLGSLDDLINLEDLTDFIGVSSLDISDENQTEGSEDAVAEENNEVSNDGVVENEAEGENNKANDDETSKEVDSSIPEGSVQLENDENSEKISNITYKLLNKILEVESEIKKEAADSSNGPSVFKEFSFDDTSSAISSAIQSKEFKNELEKIILGQDIKPTTFAGSKLDSSEGSTPISNLESAQMVQENIAPAETILGENSGSDEQGYDVDYSQILTPSADSASASSEELKDDEYDDNNFSIEKYFGISKVSGDYDDNNNDADDGDEIKEENDLESNLEDTTLDDILLEKIYEEDLNELVLGSSDNPDDPASDLLAITESLSKAISDLENTPDITYDPLEEDNKSFNILINKDDIFSVSILNESYDIVADFDGISIISENIHISTPKNNFFVKAGEDKYIEIHNNKDHFEVYTNFENIDFANAINNVEFSKKDNRLELNIKEAFKLASVKNKLQLSMLNTVIADMTSSAPSPDNIDENSICDNRTLLISEETQKVYLPYTLEEVMLKLGNNSEYKTAKEVIDKEYTLPLSTFRFPILSRFKEAYRFMRIKEKSSVYAAIDLALELMFNSNLNPAIIRACRDLKELNIYLDCLYENELEKFDCFKIVYKVLPKVK